MLFLLFLLSCSAPKSPKMPELGTAGQPIIYDDFPAIEGLFRQQSDTTYLINFWATWCRPCREEIPLLQQLATQYADAPLRVVLISLDTDTAAQQRIAPFLEEAAPTLASLVLTDEDPAWGKTIDRVWSGSLPTTILYRRQLRYVYRREFRTYVDLEGAIQPLLSATSS